MTAQPKADHVPLDSRIYVLEDIDAETPVVLKREPLELADKPSAASGASPLPEVKADDGRRGWMARSLLWGD